MMDISPTFIPGIIFVTGNIFEYEKQKTGIGEQSCVSLALTLLALERA